MVFKKKTQNMNNKMATNTHLTTESKNKINKQNKDRIIDAENILMVARLEGYNRMGVKGEESKKYKLVATEQSWGCKVQHMEYSQ